MPFTIWLWSKDAKNILRRVDCPLKPVEEYRIGRPVEAGSTIPGGLMSARNGTIGLKAGEQVRRQQTTQPAMNDHRIANGLRSGKIIGKD